jgi:SAM-dependent methyltransferase
MLHRARIHYQSRIPLVQLSAEALPFRDGAFEFVLLLEASYYVPAFERALDEIRRILSPNGRVLFVNANPERPDFIRSPYSYVYHTADQFRQMLGSRGFAVQLFGAFPIEGSANGDSPLKYRLLSLARRMGETLGVVPKTLAGRARLKRLLGQKLRFVPPEIDSGFAHRQPLTAIEAGPITALKVFYVIADRV